MTTTETNAGRFLVTGATGNVGKEVVRALSSAGASVRAALRTVSSAPVLLPSCEAVHLDFSDPATFAPALKGINGLFLMRPNPVISVKKTLNRLLDVAVDLGVTHCVFLSVAGADKNSLVPHHAVERHLMRGPMRWTMLRAGFFAQNLTGPYSADIQAGLILLPAGHGKVAYVDARDLGDAAALALRDPARHGSHAYHLTGPDSLSFDEVATMLSEELGRAVRYQPASLWGYWRHCRRNGIGLVPTFAYTMIHASLRGGSGATTAPTLSSLLGRPARGLRQFIKENRAHWARDAGARTSIHPGVRL